MSLVEFYYSETSKLSFEIKYTGFINAAFINLLNILLLIPKLERENYNIYLLKPPIPKSNFINKLIIRFIFRIYLLKHKNYYLIWFFDPELYHLHNFVKWKYLVFDYENINSLKNHHFYKHVFSKKLIFIFSNINKLFYVKKDNLGTYKKNVCKITNVNYLS